MIVVEARHHRTDGVIDQNLGLFDPVRQAEISSIRAFVRQHKGLLFGRVLDFGAGKSGICRNPQPYRDLVQAGSEYLPFDQGDTLPAPPFDVVLCTQVFQYLDDPQTILKQFHSWLIPAGVLILTYPCCWDEVEDNDYWRFTKAGMERLLIGAGFQVGIHERRAEVRMGQFRFPLGYGVVATKAPEGKS